MCLKGLTVSAQGLSRTVAEFCLTSLVSILLLLLTVATIHKHLSHRGIPSLCFS